MITARSPGDNSLRTWGVSIDTKPSGNWRKDDSVITSERHSGDLWNVDLPIADGKHTVYFIVSDTDPQSGGYDGSGILDQAAFNFKGIDNDTISAWPIVVKDGVAKSGQPSTQATSQDIETEGGTDRFQAIRKLGNRLRNLTKEQKDKIAIGGGIATAVTISGIVIYKAVKKSRRF